MDGQALLGLLHFCNGCDALNAIYLCSMTVLLAIIISLFSAVTVCAVHLVISLHGGE